MTEVARELLTTFESLSPDEQQEVTVEILRRAAPAGGLSEAALDELAGDLFRSYDAEEASRAQPKTR